MTKSFYCLLFSLFTIHSGRAQNVEYAQKMVDTLSSAFFHGRGYVADGDRKAADFILSEFRTIGLQKAGLHEFRLNVNTFPGQMTIESDRGALVAGKDFVVDPSCPGFRLKKSKLFKIGQNDFENEAAYQKLMHTNFKRKAVLLDTLTDSDIVITRSEQFKKLFDGKCLIEVKRKLTWSVSRNQAKRPVIWVLPGILNSACTITADIEAELINDYQTANVIGFIPGTAVPDSFIILMGHYDHLGRMGKGVYMPGANDNASGIAMILDLAREFKLNPPKYSVLIIAFAGEEAGLVGSYVFVQEMDKYIEKDKIRFLINMDLMGSGEDGLMAVNGKVFTEEFELLSQINDDGKFLTQIRSRGKAANSDHYFFTEAGVRGFFFYLMGKYQFYHEVEDSSDNLKLQPEPYNNSFRLIRDFARALMYDEPSK